MSKWLNLEIEVKFSVTLFSKCKYEIVCDLGEGKEWALRTSKLPSGVDLVID